MKQLLLIACIALPGCAMTPYEKEALMYGITQGGQNVREITTPGYYPQQPQQQTICHLEGDRRVVCNTR
jgi:hypothetical protein